jgi:hypothetical protein
MDDGLGERLWMSPTCCEFVSDRGHARCLRELSDLSNRIISDEEALALAHARESSLMEQLKSTGGAVVRHEEGAHGVLRCDDVVLSTDSAVQVSLLRDRALSRAQEWAAAFGGGHTTLSQLLVPRPAAVTACDCRREAWVVQLYARTRRLQVAACRVSGLPPEGKGSRMLDVTWLDEAGADGVQHGLPRLEAFLAAVAPEPSEYDADATRDALQRLELPPLDYLHLLSQPLFRGSDCAGLGRVLAAVGAELCAWARLGEALAPADGAIDALRLARQQPPRRRPTKRIGSGHHHSSQGAPPQHSTRADLAVRWWGRLDLYVGCALLGHAELGLRSWLAAANATLRAYPAEDGQPDAQTPLLLVLRLRRHPHADEERKWRATRLLEWLSKAPEPVGTIMRELCSPEPTDAALHPRED